METLIEQLKAAGFGEGIGADYFTRRNADGAHGGEASVFIANESAVCVDVSVLGAGSVKRWFPGDVTAEQVEAFITRARRIIAEWDTMEVSFQGGAE